MNRTSIALAVLVLAACAPQASGPEAAVSAVYKPLAESKGQTGTDIASIPFTADMAEQIKAVEAKADGAVFDFDIAGNCQDCTGFSDLKVATPLGPAHVSEDGHYFIEATFKFESGERSSMIWDMVEIDGA